MIKSFSVQNKVLLFLLLLTLSLYLSVTFVFYSNTLNSTKKDAINKLETLANVQYQRLNLFITHNKKILKLLNNTPELKERITEFNKTKDKKLIGDLKIHLNKTIEHIDYIENLLILDNKNNITYISKPDENITTKYKKSSFNTQKNVSVIYTKNSKKPIDIFFSLPIDKNNPKLGHLVLQVDIDSLNSYLKDYTGLGKTGEVLMAYKYEDKMVFFTPLRFKESPIVVDINSNLAIPMRYALSKEEKIFEEASDYIGVPVIAISKYLEELNFGIVVKMNTEEVLSINDELKQLITKLIIGLFILVSIASYVISTLLTTPIKMQEKLTKKAQKESLKKSLALSSGTIGVWEWSFKNDNLIWDDTMYKIFDIEKYTADSPKKIFFENIDDTTKKDIEEKLQNAQTKNQEFNTKLWFTTKKGNKKYIHIIGRSEYNHTNTPTRLVGIMTDITEPYLQEKEILEKAKKLQEQKEEFETIFNYAQDGIVIIDLNLNILNFNKAFLNMTNFSDDDLKTKTWDRLIIKEDLPKAKQLIEHIIKYNIYENIQTSIIIKDDKRISINMGLSLLPDKKRVLLVIKDTTALKIMEDQAKLASMGEMIGNIAHQWRQPLSVITASASSIKLKYMLGQEVDKATTENFSTKIIEQAKYLSKTIDDFKNFIRGDAKFEKTTLHEILDSTLSLTSATISNNNINLIQDTKLDIEVIGNKNEIQQALINIINNAKDALKENIVNDEDRYLAISTKLISQDTLELEIYDNGGGIDENVIDKIFEPYFSTKHQSVGTGLGLSMSYKIIVERHKQKIVVSNEQREFNGKMYKGASFKIVFKKFVT